MAAQPNEIGRAAPIAIDPLIYELYDEYCHGRMDRREFLARAGALVIGGFAMAPTRSRISKASFEMPSIAGIMATAFITG